MTKSALAMALGDENWGEELAGGWGEKKKRNQIKSSSVYIKPIEIGLNYSVWLE